MAVLYNNENDVPVITIDGTVDGWGWMRSTLNYYLQKCGKKNVRVRVNSYGGDVNEGMAISRLLEDHGNVTVEFAGFNASAATWMAFGAKSIEIREDSLWLCHHAAVGVDLYGNMNSDQLKDAIDELKKNKKTADALDLIIAQKYLDRCGKKGKNLKDVLDLMDKEPWLTADDVIAWGFADKKIPGINKVSKDVMNLIVQNCIDLHLPVPTFIEESAQENNDEENAIKDTLIQKIVGAIKPLFATAKKDDVDPAYTNNKNKSEMNEKFVQVMALLAVNAIEVKDGKVTLSVDQLSKLESTLTELNAAKSENKKATDALDKISDTVKTTEGLANKVNVIKMVMDMMPNGIPTTVVASNVEKKPDYSDVAKDPINAEVRNN